MATDAFLEPLKGLNATWPMGTRVLRSYLQVVSPGFDGQWSSLSLFCAKDCKPFNATSLELSRCLDEIGVHGTVGPRAAKLRGFRVIMDMSRPNGEGEPSPSSGEPDAPHGHWSGIRRVW